MSTSQFNSQSPKRTAAFDGAAAEYDAVFTESPIGKMQRKVVWEYLDGEMGGLGDLNVLELNCGTGKDAIWLAGKGHRVWATDVSPEMVDLTWQKVNDRGLGNQVTCLETGFQDVKNKVAGLNFDWIFSNFGGWNCLDASGIRKLGADLAELLPPGGRLTVVIMPRNTLWEAAYFGLQINFKKAFRRWSGGPVTAQLNPGTVRVWYHNPSEIEAMLSHWFKLRTTRSIGFLVPPSYLDPFFKHRPKTLKFLKNQDRKLRRQAWLARFSDHYLLDFQRK